MKATIYAVIMTNEDVQIKDFSITDIYLADDEDEMVHLYGDCDEKELPTVTFECDDMRFIPDSEKDYVHYYVSNTIWRDSRMDRELPFDRRIGNEYDDFFIDTISTYIDIEGEEVKDFDFDVKVFAKFNDDEFMRVFSTREAIEFYKGE